MKFFIVAAVISSSHLQAQQDTTGRLLDEVTLTSNKYPKKQSETGKIVTIISRQQLENSSGKTLNEVLNTVAGTTIIGANNNPGTNQTVSIRGAAAGNTLIMIDGIPANDPSVITNYFDLNFFSIDQAERIEILKGGQSTLYGSDAVAGVINIITRKASAGKMNINGSMTGGSYGTFKQHTGLGGKCKAVTYSAAYTHLSAKGFSTAYDKNSTGSFDKDELDQHAASGRIGFAITKKLEIHIYSTYSFYQTDLDASAFTDDKDYTVKNDNLQTGTGLSYSHKRGSLYFNYHFNYAERDYLDDSVFKSNPYTDYSKSRYIGRTHYAELYNNWNWTNWELLVGTDYRMNNTDQSYFSTGLFGPYTPPVLNAKMNQLSPYASLVYKDQHGFTAELGGRWNLHSEYGNNFTYTINPSYLINKKVKVFANFYSAFKTPTLYQLFDPSAGNKDLKPEKGTMAEAGTELFTDKVLRIRAVGFYSNTNEAIVYTYDPSTFASKYLNVGNQKNYGTELEVTYKINKWSVAANYTYTDGKTKSGYDGTGNLLGKDTTYYNLYRIPKNAFNLDIGWQATNEFFISTQLRTVSKRKEFIYGSSPETLNGYATIDLYGQYAFSKKVKIFIALKNITNKEYFDILGYNSRKFNFSAGVNFNL